jgi:hypothetical protein
MAMNRNRGASSLNDRFAPVSPIESVIDRSLKFDARFASHARVLSGQYLPGSSEIPEIALDAAGGRCGRACHVLCPLHIALRDLVERIGRPALIHVAEVLLAPFSELSCLGPRSGRIVAESSCRRQ